MIEKMETETDGQLLFLAWWHVLVFLTRTMGAWQQRVTMATFKVAGWDYDNVANTVRITSDEALFGISDTLCFSYDKADFPNVFLSLSLSSFLL